jgi:hypothetical protein
MGHVSSFKDEKSRPKVLSRLSAIYGILLPFLFTAGFVSPDYLKVTDLSGKFLARVWSELLSCDNVGGPCMYSIGVNFEEIVQPVAK